MMMEDVVPQFEDRFYSPGQAFITVDKIFEKFKKFSRDTMSGGMSSNDALKLAENISKLQKSNISLQNKYYGGVNFKKNPTYFAWPETPAPEVKKEPENAVITRLITYSCIFTHFMYLLD